MPERPFASERTRRFRATELSEFNRKEIGDIEQFGCQVLHVAGNEAGPPGFSYTIGIFDTCGRPEIIEVGLPQKTAHYLLNEAARRLRSGVDLSRGRHADMIGGVECEFRPVETKWVKRLMHGSNWYYRDTEYPVLQAVYPDLNSHFPEDSEFDRAFMQPLLQPNAPFTVAEEDFWASAVEQSLQLEVPRSASHKSVSVVRSALWRRGGYLRFT